MLRLPEGSAIYTVTPAEGVHKNSKLSPWGHPPDRRETERKRGIGSTGNVVSAGRSAIRRTIVRRDILCGSLKIRDEFFEREDG